MGLVATVLETKISPDLKTNFTTGESYCYLKSCEILSVYVTQFRRASSVFSFPN